MAATQAMAAKITELSASEKKVYDRQLRVWGVDTQLRLSNASLLLVNATSLLAAETAKNLVLAGVGSLTVVDNTPLSSPTRPASNTNNYLVNAASSSSDSHETYGSALAASLQELNPLVRVHHVCTSASSLSADTLAGATLVAAFGLSTADFDSISRLCRAQSKPYYLGASAGGYAFWFSDLGDEVQYEGDGKEAGRMLSKRFVSLKDALAADWASMPRRMTKGYALLRAVWTTAPELFSTGVVPDVQGVLHALASQPCKETFKPSAENVRAWLNDEVAPFAPECEDIAICSVVGGVLANEVLKSISRKGEPAGNFFFYGQDLVASQGAVEKVGM